MCSCRLVVISADRTWTRQCFSAAEGVRPSVPPSVRGVPVAVVTLGRHLRHHLLTLAELCHCRATPLTVATMSALKSLSVTSAAVIMTVFLLSIVSAQNELELSPQLDLESMDEIQELLRKVQFVYDMKLAQRAVRENEEVDGENDVQNVCNCDIPTCSCCTLVRARIIKLEGKFCLSLTYLRRNYGFLISLTFGSRLLFSKEVSARNPPAVCSNIPRMRSFVAACIQFYNLDVSTTTVSGCTRLQVTVFRKVIIKVSLGCFRMNFRIAAKQFEAVELPYLDGQPAPAEGPEPPYLSEVEMEKIKPSEYKKN